MDKLEGKQPEASDHMDEYIEGFVWDWFSIVLFFGAKVIL